MLKISRTRLFALAGAVAGVLLFAFAYSDFVSRDSLELPVRNVFPVANSLAAEPALESPEKVVDRLWAMATEGEWFNEEGRKRISGLFLEAHSDNSEVSVVSNYWGSASCSRMEGTAAEVIVGFEPLGKIDRNLRFVPDKPTTKIYLKYGALYHLIKVPTYSVMYVVQGGKTVTTKKPSGWAWVIADADHPFTTVNTAIRYVLETSEQSKDSQIKQNAEQTVKELLKYR